MNSTVTDPRPSYAAATEWVHGLLARVTDDQWSLPTPCDEFDVRTLSGHLNAVGMRSVALATVATVEGQPVIADEHDAATFAALRERSLAAWAAAPLDREVSVPWGVVPGYAALGMYVGEMLVHGWDLAMATGQHGEIDDPALPEFALGVAKMALPPEIRGGDTVPFGAVVTPRDDAGPTERLANWYGRPSEPWRSAA